MTRRLTRMLWPECARTAASSMARGLAMVITQVSGSWAAGSSCRWPPACRGTSASTRGAQSVARAPPRECPRSASLRLRCARCSKGSSGLKGLRRAPRMSGHTESSIVRKPRCAAPSLMPSFSADTARMRNLKFVYSQVPVLSVPVKKMVVRTGFQSCVGGRASGLSMTLQPTNRALSSMLRDPFLAALGVGWKEVTTQARANWLVSRAMVTRWCCGR
mmetsp:Transcript_8094/g.27481  ORF Transcript_8094/g.27481 Transcript_8094/m.27481 type:complete len:218 (-) Transcript_8094:240-893(-)